jgi:hypothetical protein
MPRRRGLALLHPVAGRWSYLRKFEICRAIRSDLLTEEEVIAAHGLSAEELSSWLYRFDRAGSEGLKCTKRLA